MQEIRDALKKIVQDSYGLNFDPEVVPSPENISADFSTNAPLKLAKELHKPPFEIAEELAQKAEQDTLLRTFSPFVSKPGFLNFMSRDEYLTTKVAELSSNFAKNILSEEYKDKVIICEFSDPNPFKVLHVGHLYTSIVGDSISRLYEYAGAKVIRANFGGDVGLHVAKTLYVLEQKFDDTNFTIEDISKSYVAGSALYEDDEKAKQAISELNKEIYEINTKDLHDTKLAQFYWRGRELSYEYFADFYAKTGLKFDKYYPESAVAELGLKTVKEQLEKNVYELSNGAIIFKGENFGLHTRVFVNQAGVPTYEAKDVGLIFTKWQDYHFDKSIIITANEQFDYMKVVLKSIEQFAPDLVAKTKHLTHGLVKLPGSVKMSSRKGNFLKAVDVLDLIEENLQSEYGSSDKAIALAATKYAFLKYKMGGQIIFDPHESVKMTGNSGPYLLYSAVRAKKILEKANTTDVSKTTASLALVPEERTLIKKILIYKDVLSEAVRGMAPHRLATYLYEIAQDFSRFYETCPVAGNPRESERKKLVQLYLDIMNHGLDILGIKVPEKM